MVDVMIIVELVALALLSLVTLAFVVSSAWEREKRAALIGGLTLFILLAGFTGPVVLYTVGFFESTFGLLRSPSRIDHPSRCCAGPDSWRPQSQGSIGHKGSTCWRCGTV